jgi:hypothetical protein
MGFKAWRSLPCGEEREKGAQKQNDVPDPPSLSCSMVLKAKLFLNLCDCGTTVTKSTK